MEVFKRYFWKFLAGLFGAEARNLRENPPELEEQAYDDDGYHRRSPSDGSHAKLTHERYSRRPRSEL